MSKKYYKNKPKNAVITTDQSIDNEAKDIFDKIVAVNSSPNDNNLNFDELVTLFNQNQSKKTMLRILKSSVLWDKITEQALERFEKSPDEFSNQDLLNYMKVVQDSILNSQKQLGNSLEQSKTPLIQVNTQSINLNGDGQLPDVNRESQEKIVDVVNKLFKLMETQQTTEEEVVEAEYEEAKEIKDE